MKNNKKSTYWKTYLSYKMYKLSERFVKKWTIIYFLTIIILTFLLFYFSCQTFNFSKYPVIISEVFISYLDIEHINDDNIKSAIFTIISSLTVIISLLSAIYVFTHREQKTVSPSASTDNRKNNLLIKVISLMIFNIVFGSLIVREYNGLLSLGQSTSSLDITKDLYSRILLLGISLLILINLIIVFIKYLFKTMSVDNMLKDSVDHASIVFDSLLSMHRAEKFKTFIDIKYNKFHLSLESVFQNLKFAADNNMNQKFEENIKEFKKVFDKLKQKHNDIHVSTYLLNNESEKFFHCYHSALRSNLSLIGTLLKNQQYNKAKKAVSLYFNMYVKSDEVLVKIFKITLNDFLDIINTNDEKQLLIFLDGLKEIPEDQTLLAYKFLLMKLVNKNEMKNITNVVYDFQFEDKKLKSSPVVILLQSLIKSVEISNYQITGFIIKFLLTNHSGSEINRCLVILKKNKSAFSKVLEEGENIEGISEDDVYAIKINDETFDYCYKKVCILLYAQHVYSIKNALWYVDKWNEKGNEIKLRKEFKDIPYTKYIMLKIQKPSSKYGLLFFEDKEVMKNVYNELNLTFDSKNDNNKHLLPETIGALIKKTFKL